jgi:glycosyltransferase involved in cell wall biosynthesis
VTTSASARIQHRPRVLSVGPDPDGRGGMVTVTRLMMRHCGPVAELSVVRTHVDGPLARRVAVWVGGTARVLLRLVTRRVDVLHLHVSRRGSILRKIILAHAAGALRVPLVLHCHAGQFSDEFRAMPRAVQRLVAAGFRRADQLVVLGDRWRNDYVDLIGIPADRVVVVTNPVELPAAVPPRPGPPVRIAYLGRFDEGKGTADLLRAMAALPADIRSRSLLSMAGDGDVDGVRTLCTALGLDGVVRISGWFGPRERDAVLAESSVFVLPSYHEGLPMAMLEAMAWGVVPVVTPVGSIPEIVVDGHNGLLVQPGDVAGIAAAVARLVADPELVARLSTAARSSAARHGTEPFVRRLAQVWAAARATRSSVARPTGGSRADTAA